jgi:HAD superfamily hydrolase (TIGR01509 family)
MIKGAIFDMDGTLLDTMPLWDNAGAMYLETLGVAAKPDLGKVLYPMTFPQAAAYLKKEYALTQSETEIVGGIERTVGDFYFYKAQAKKGAGEFLEGLAARGIKSAVATLTEKRLALPALTRLGLAPYFEDIITADEVSCGKESPEIFLRAADALAVLPGQTLVLEDALFAAKTAAGAGFVTVGVYDASAADVQDELARVCAYYIKDFGDFSAFAAEALR